MLIKSMMDGASIYKTSHGDMVRWEHRGAIIDVPQAIVDGAQFQRNISKGLLAYADEKDYIMYILAHPSAEISHAV